MALVPRRRDDWDILRNIDDYFRWPTDFWEDRASFQLRSMATDVYETDEAVVVEMAAIGVKPEDININVTGDTLTVSGESKSEQEENKRNYYQKQLRYGSFAQTVTLPVSVDANRAEARFENGLLKITLPKAEEAKPKKIQIKAKS